MSSTTDVSAPSPEAQIRPERPTGVAALICGVLTAAVGLVGAVVGIGATFHTFQVVHISWLLAFTGVRFAIDPVGGFFMAVTGGVAVPVGLFAVGYGRRARLPVVAAVVMPLFVTAMLLVLAAGSVSTFLLMWELMALGSVLLVLTEHRRAQVRAAGVFYAVMTQLGFAAILIALMLLASGTHADTFGGLAQHAPALSSGTRTIVFVFSLVGFGSKAGLVPLHAWLPRAHPEAPSPVSALMSAAMVNLGIYGIVRFDLLMLGPGARWWGLCLMVVGAGSALYGVLQASVATDLKRLLAYSTTENMGLVALALGASTTLYAAGAAGVAAIALAAALLHVLCHAAFKTLAFLAAGSVLAGTGLRDLDRLGGLARRMPATTALFGLAALGACGLPLGAGFVSEWLLVQSLIHAPSDADTLTRLAMPLAVGVVALTAGLGVVAMVKAFGVGFLARPRSSGASQAREASGSMVAGMGLAAAACLILAVAPVAIGPTLARVLEAFPVGRSTSGPDLGLRLRLPGVAGSMSPTWLAAALIAACALAAGLARRGTQHRPAPATSALWACGADSLSSRMQYTATSFAEPLQRVFDDVLRPDTDIEITHHEQSRYLVTEVSVHSRQLDGIEQRLYDPVVRAVQTWAGWVRRAHPGSVNVYLGYGAVGLLIVLLVAR